MDLCNPKEIKALLGRHGFRFSKQMGQNFLIQPWVPRQTAEASGAGPGIGVLEIGPGIGVLTKELAKRAAKVLAAIPHTSAVLETDCPYMAPEPVRGIRCDSSLIRYVGAYIAQRKALAPEEVFRATAANARRVFGL